MHSFNRIFSGVVAAGVFGGGDVVAVAGDSSPSIFWPTSLAVASGIKMTESTESTDFSSNSSEDVEEAKKVARNVAFAKLQEDLPRIDDKVLESLILRSLKDHDVEEGLKSLVKYRDIRWSSEDKLELQKDAITWIFHWIKDLKKKQKEEKEARDTRNAIIVVILIVLGIIGLGLADYFYLEEGGFIRNFQIPYVALLVVAVLCVVGGLFTLLLMFIMNEFKCGEN